MGRIIWGLVLLALIWVFANSAQLGALLAGLQGAVMTPDHQVYAMWIGFAVVVGLGLWVRKNV